MSIFQKRFVLCIFFLAVTTIGYGQNDSTQTIRKAFYVELGGSGDALSINYDQTLYGSWVGRVGLGFLFDFSKEELLSRAIREEVRWQSYGLSLPLATSYLIGRDKKFLELGTGVTFEWYSEKNTISERDHYFYVMPSALVGYRRQPRDNGFLFRIVAGPMYHDKNVYPHLGLSFGFVKR
jgi:hypothetical protein